MPKLKRTQKVANLGDHAIKVLTFWSILDKYLTWISQQKQKIVQSKISLRGQFHWAMLGVCKEGIPWVSCIVSWSWSWKKCHPCAECCAFGRYVMHSSIIMLSHSHIVPIAYLYLVDSPPDLYGLWMHMIKGLTGSQAAWTSQKYRGYRTLPDTILAELNNANII